MISTLIKYKIKMLKNRVFDMPLAEKAAHFLAALLVMAFVGIITTIFVKRSDRIFEFLNPATYHYFNFLCVFLLNGILGVAIFVEAIQEIHTIYYRRESQFLLLFPQNYAHYFGYKILSVSLKLFPVLVLLFPFYLMHVFYFTKYYSGVAAGGFVLFSLFALALILPFSAALALMFTAAFAKLLSLFRQRTLIALMIVSTAFTIGVYYPALSGAGGEYEKKSREKTLEILSARLESTAGYFRYFPASMAAAAPEHFIRGEHLAAAKNLFYAIISMFIALLSSFIFTWRFLLKDIGCLMDSISLRQNIASSLGYFRPLASLPAVWRGAIYDELAHAMRQNMIIFFFLMTASLFVAPFFIPEKFFAVVSGASPAALEAAAVAARLMKAGAGPAARAVESAAASAPRDGGWIVFAICSVVLLYGTDLMATDFTYKRSFLQIMRSMPLKMFDFLRAKVVFYSLAGAALLAVVSAPWIYFLGFGPGRIVAHAFLIAMWSCAGSLVCYGAGSLVFALVSARRDPDGLRVFNFAVKIAIFVLMTVFCLSLSMLQRLGCQMPFLLLYIFAWSATFYFALVKGSKMLENKELLT